MLRAISFGGVLLLALVTLGHTAPVTGPEHLVGKRVGAQGSTEILREFAGGERACVIAIGDHKPVVPLKIVVLDEANRVVAQDEGTDTRIGEQAGNADYVAVIWYPPRRGTYRIVIQNAGVEYNDLYIAIK